MLAAIQNKIEERVLLSHVSAIFFLIVFTLLVILPGFFTLPPTDRDESRFAQATKQMVETNNYLDIRFQAEPRYKKPIGIYWLQAAAVKLSGLGAEAPIWVYRLPSLLGAVLAVLATYWAMLPLMKRENAFYAALLMSCCVLIGVEARLAKTDAMLLACTTFALGSLLRAYLFQMSRWLAYAFWFVLAIGVLIKGPLILLSVGLTAAALFYFKRSTKWLKNLYPFTGFLLFLLCCAPWFVVIGIASKGEFFALSVGKDMFGKVASGAEQHWGPPGFYLATIWLTFFPAATFLGALLPTLWREKMREPFLLLWCWVLPTFIVFEIFQTKLPHYVLPTFPALAGLIVLAAEKTNWNFSSRWQRFCLSGLITLPFILMMTLGAVLFYLREPIDIWANYTAVFVVFFGFVAFVMSKDQGRFVLLPACLSFILLNVVVFERMLPKAESLWLSPQMLALAERYITCPNPELASAAYHEPSLVFLTDTNILLTDGGGAAQFIRQGKCRYAFIDEAPGRNGETPQLTAFLAEVKKSGGVAQLFDVVEGRNMNGGHARRIGFWTIKP